MPGSSDTLWSFFIAGALGLIILVVAFVAAILIAQRRYLILHGTYNRRLLAALDEERAGVAREVHDNAVQHLSLVANGLQLMALKSQTLSDSDRERLEELRGELRDLATSLRNLAYRLHPQTLELGEPREVFRQLAEDMERTYGLGVNLACDSVPSITGDGRLLALFRIAQEALRNVWRHAGTDCAWVTLKVANGEVVMEIRDRGRGIDQDGRNGAARHVGLGLLTMKERARLVGGRTTISSEPSGGTTVRVSIPLEERYG